MNEPRQESQGECGSQTRLVPRAQLRLIVTITALMVFVSLIFNAYQRQRKSYKASAIEVVHFDIPSFVNKSAVPERVLPCSQHGVGYRHMCRFHAKTVYEQPILEGLRYVWRLDDDSYITKPIRYDVFRLMRDRRLQYGYVAWMNDGLDCVRGLWPAVNNYMQQHGIRPKFHWPLGRIIYNNFEVSDLDVWRSTEYRDYVDYIDRTGGIFYGRWGDATIKTIAVTLFIPQNRIHLFRNIEYKHGRSRRLFT